MTDLLKIVYDDEKEPPAESAPALTPLERLRRQMVKRGMIAP
jgi:hypothetical protein